MSRTVRIVVSVIFIAVFAYAFTQWSGKSQKNDIYSQLSSLKGFDRSQIEGKYFILHFWAKWCAPCAEEIPHLVEFAQKNALELPQLKILAVSLDETLEQSKTILPQKGEGLPVNFLLYLDPEHHIAETLGSYQYPETYFYGPQGNVIQKWVGPQKWESAEVIEYFRRQTLTKP